MSYNRFWVLWLGEHVPKIYWISIKQIFLLNGQWVLIKTEIALSNTKMGKNVLYLIPDMHWLAELPTKTVKYRVIKVDWLTGSDPKEVAKLSLGYSF